MENYPLHNYSDVLLPLPPINGTNSVLPKDFVPDPKADFSDILAGKLDESEPVQTKPQIDFFPGSVTPQIEQPPAISDEEAAELMDACKQVEGFLLSLLLKSMGESFAGDSVFSSTYESSVYKDMFFFELANSIGTDGPGLGIAQTLYDDIIMKTNGGLLDVNLTG